MVNGVVEVRGLLRTPKPISNGRHDSLSFSIIAHNLFQVFQETGESCLSLLGFLLKPGHHLPDVPLFEAVSSEHFGPRPGFK